MDSSSQQVISRLLTAERRKNLWNSSKYTKYFKTFLQSRSRNWQKFSNQDAGWFPIRIMNKFVFAIQCVLIILRKGKSSLTWSRSAFSPWGTATTRTVLGLERNKKCQEGREKLPTLMTQDLQRNATNWRQPAVRVFGEDLPEPGVISPHLRLQLSQKKHLQKMSIFWTTCKRGRWGICKKMYMYTFQ